MKIFEIIPQLSTGGAERFVVDLSNELSRQNEVFLITFWPIDGVHGFYTSQVSDRVKLFCLNKKAGFDLSVFYNLYTLIRKYRPDIIHSHVDAILYTHVFQIYYKNGFHTVHSQADKEAVGCLHRFIRKITFKLGLIRAVTISEDSHNSFVSFYKTDACLIKNGRDIPCGLKVSHKVMTEFKRFKRTETTKVIVHLAHIDDVKRQLLMAKVASRLFDEGFDFSVIFIGRASDEKYYNELKDSIPANCFILGERKNPLEYLKEAKAYGLCSLYEGLPISLIEALGVGAIPICTPVGGIVNVIKNEQNGFLSTDISENSYYLALKKYLTTKEDDLRKISLNAIESYKPYSMRECAEHYLNLFKKSIIIDTN